MVKNFQVVSPLIVLDCGTTSFPRKSFYDQRVTLIRIKGQMSHDPWTLGQYNINIENMIFVVNPIIMGVLSLLSKIK